ncbi:MAG: DUF4123 domain-containing protein [Polyangiaceae bacterium]
MSSQQPASSRPAAALIVAVSGGPKRGKKAAIRPGQTLIVGRSSQAGLSLSDAPRLSARHFEVAWDGEVPRIRDLASHDGTRLDGQPISDEEARNAAWIRAGEVDFTLHIEGYTPPDRTDEDDADEPEAPTTALADSPPPDAPEEEPFATEDAEPEEDDGAFYTGDNAEMRWNARQAAKQARLERSAREAALSLAAPLLESIAAEGPIHAVLDSARTPRILTVLREAVEEHRSLYEGTAGEALDDVAPYLVRLESGSRLLGQLLSEGWCRRWGIYLVGDVRERDLRRHLRRFLLVEEEDTRERLYFRYYDPAALLSVWSTCSRRQKDDLLGPLKAFLIEGPRGEVLRLTAAGDIEPLTSPWTR